MQRPNFDQNSGLARAGYTEITETDPSKFKGWSGTEVYKAVDVIAAAAERVAAGTMTKSALHDLQMVYGLNFNPYGLLANKSLRPFFDPVQVMRWDWVHNTLSNGVLTNEASLLLKACEPHGIQRSDIELWLQDPNWCFCKAHATKCKQLHRIFSHWRISNETPDKLNVSASELLSLYGLLRAFINDRAGCIPEVVDKLRSFNAGCSVVDAIIACKRGMRSPADTAVVVRRLACEHLRQHIHAYGTDSVKPKAHWNLDVADQFAIDNAVVDMFIVERNHLTVKRTADNVKNCQRFERSVLAKLFCEATDGVREGVGPHSLHGKVAQLDGATWVSDRLTSYGLEVSRLTACEQNAFL